MFVKSNQISFLTYLGFLKDFKAIIMYNNLRWFSYLNLNSF